MTFTRYNTDDLEVRTVALLLGCKPDTGLSNTMNELSREKWQHLVNAGIDVTYGEMLRDVVAKVLAVSKQEG